MAKNKYYAVKAGKKTGIYTNWEECREQVINFKGAIYKGFVLREDAENYLKGNEAAVEEEICENGVIAYVDGSFVEGNKFGCGCVIIKAGEIIEEISEAFEDEELAGMRNVAGEIKASELAMKYALDNGYKELSIYHDYQGISSWCLGEWKTNKAGTIAYKRFYDEIKDKLRVKFIKVKGHSGDEFNDLADLLAKKALNI